ncbi:hypothetical protein ACLX1H_009751 [Fusarium chlamydosporum]
MASFCSWRPRWRSPPAEQDEGIELPELPQLPELPALARLPPPAVLQPERTSTIVPASSAGAKAPTDSRGEPLRGEPPEPRQSQPDRSRRHRDIRHGDLALEGNHCVMCGKPYCDTTERCEFRKWRESEVRMFLPCGHHFGASCLKRFLRASDPHDRCPMGDCLPIYHSCDHITFPQLQAHDSFRLPLIGRDSLPSECEFCRSRLGSKLRHDLEEHCQKWYDDRRSIKSRIYHEVLTRMKLCQLKMAYCICRRKPFVKSKLQTVKHLVKIVVFGPHRQNEGQIPDEDSPEENPPKDQNPDGNSADENPPENQNPREDPPETQNPGDDSPEQDSPNQNPDRTHPEENSPGDRNPDNDSPDNQNP